MFLNSRWTVLKGFVNGYPVINFDSLKLQKITENMIVNCMKDANIFTSHATLYCKPAFTEIIDSEKATSQFLIYPNPSSGRFHIDTQTENVEFSFFLYDMEGRLLFEKAKLIGQHHEILLEDFNSGIYMYKILSRKTKSTTGKLVLFKQ